MDIVKTGTEWAKAEVLSSSFFILFGVLLIAASIGFWQLGKTEVARAFIYPTLVTGILLLILGAGLMFSSKSKVATFSTAYEADPIAFVQTEIARAEKTIGEYRNVALKVFPAIIALAALLIIFVDKPLWRAIGITTIAMMLVIVWVDSTAKARMEAYHQELLLEQEALKDN